MPLRFAQTLRESRAQALVAAIDAAAGAGYFNFYTGVQPATPETATDGSHTLLGTVTCSVNSATVATAGGVTSTTFNAFTADSEADATGLASWARAFDGNNTAVADFTCGGVGSGANLELTPTAQVYAGGSLNISSLVISEAA